MVKSDVKRDKAVSSIMMIMPHTVQDPDKDRRISVKYSC